jgi:tetratricopeptide (TPR) repeat protein
MLFDARGLAKWTALVLVAVAATATTMAIVSTGATRGLFSANSEDDAPAPPPSASDDEPETAKDSKDKPPEDEGPAPDPGDGSEEAPPPSPPDDEKPAEAAPTNDKPADAVTPPGSADSPATDATSDGPSSSSAAPAELPSTADRPEPSPIKRQVETIEAATRRMEAAMLNGVRPGLTTVDELHRAWGQPVQVDRAAGATRETYEIKPLGKTRATIVDGLVDSLAIQLETPLEIAQAAKHLQIDDFEPVEVLNDEGKLVGQAYPERGVMFGFTQKSKPPSVFQVVIEPVDAQPFLDRAARRLQDRFADCFDDIQQALAIAPDSLRAQWLHAELTLRAGDLEQALQSAEKTVKLAPAELEYRLTLAKVESATSDYAEAIKNVTAVATAKQVPAVLLARAHLLWGDCLAGCEKHDYEQAMRQHMKAIAIAESLVGSPKYSERRAAKELLVDAHLAVARDIGWGRWQQKSKVVPKWIERATVFADDLVAREHASPEIQFRVHERALAALAGIGQPPDAGVWIRGVTDLGKKLLDHSSDPPYQAHLAWRIGVALADAVEVEAMRQKLDRALALGSSALEFLDKGEAAGKQLVARDFLRGRLCYRLGAVFAVQKSEHERAIPWYDRAVPLLETPVPAAAADCGKQGELFVSMAVSYWETSNRREALRLTNQGVKLMERAASEGLLEKPALAVPYSNLASMHEQLGDVQQARKYAELAARHEATR